MLKRQIQIHAARAQFGRAVEIDFFLAGDAGPARAAKPVEMVEVSDEFADRVPALTLHTEAAQRLIDALWDCGLRPSQGQQSHGQFAAQGRHLEDMRALVAATAKVELPK